MGLTQAGLAGNLDPHELPHDIKTLSELKLAGIGRFASRSPVRSR